MPSVDSYTELPIGFKTIQMREETEHVLTDTDDDRFVEIDVQSVSASVKLPDDTESNNGDTFWIAETGGRGGLFLNDENMTTMNPSTLAAFVSRGTHWECISSDLPWS